MDALYAGERPAKRRLESVEQLATRKRLHDRNAHTRLLLPERVTPCAAVHNAVEVGILIDAVDKAKTA